jgi:hypothetical protein
MMANMMMPGNRRPMKPEPEGMLRWVFHRGDDALTCAVEVSGRRSSYDVCIFPHWNLSEATVEHFDGAASALHRHAEIASGLRERGWVAQYGASHHAGTAV